MTAKTFIKITLTICFFSVGNKSFNQSWSQKANIPSGAGSYINFSTNGKGYMMAPFSTALLEYNPTTNTWTTKAAFPGTPRESAVAFTIGSKGYIATGVQMDGGLLNDLWEYNAIANTWTQRANFPGGARQNAIAFSIGGNGYLGTGYDGTIKNDFWEYNPTTNVWTPKTDFGGGMRAEAVGFSIGDKGYIGTGTSSLDNTGLKNDLWEFNPGTNSWTQKANLPAAARVVAVAFSLGMKAYLGTGSGDINAGPGPFYHDFWRYDPSTNAWTSQPDYPGAGSFLLSGFSIGANAFVGAGEGGATFSDFWQFSTPDGNVGSWIVRGTSPTPRRGEAAATSNGIVYVVGGAPPFSTSSVATAEAYNPATNSWTTLASMPIASQQLTAQSINGIVYAVAGGGCCGAYSDVQAYNPATNTWTLKASAPTARYGATSAVVNNKMYVMSGGSGYGALYQNLEVYDPVTNSWTTKASMPFFRGGCAAIAVNGIIYAIGGGNSSGTIFGTVQAYDPSTDTWSIKSGMPTPRGGLTVTVHNNKIYAIAGNNNTDGDIGIVEIYDPATDTWTSGPPLGPALQSLASATVNNKLYTFGGTITAYPNSPVLTVEELTPACPATGSSTTIIACDQYMWNGVVYTTSGDKIYTTTNAAGCDSIATLHLTINHSSTSSTTVTACDQYLWNGVVYTISGDKTYTTTNAAGCDSIATLHLTINHSTASSTTVTACDQYLWNGVVYTTSGDKIFTIMNAAGCDSVATLHLTINHSTTSSTTVTACDQYLWNGVVYTTSGDKIYTTTNAAGCDSIATLHLTINHSTASSTTVTACDQYLWNGVVYTTSGDKIYTTTNAAGCDSVATLHLTINHSTSSSTTVTACDQYLWNGVVYTTSGDNIYTTTNAAGCDSIATLHLTINHSTTSSTTVTACDQYSWNGVVYTTSGDKIYTTTNAAGCDSVATLHLTIINGNTVPLITCPPGGAFIRGTNANCKYTIVDGEFNATASATCGTPTLSYVLTGATTGTGSSTLSGIVLNKGITAINWTASNGSLTSTCSFNVNVVDNQAPLVTCPGNISTTLKGRNCNTKVKTLNPTYSDNCGAVTALTWVMSGATSGSSPVTGINNAGSQSFNAGTTTVTYTAKDAVGNSSTCSFTVTVVNPNCPNPLITKISAETIRTKKILVGELTIIVNPNPSINHFTFKIESNNPEQKVSVRILDLLGRQLETRDNLSANQTLQIGNNYKAGVYIAEIIQGNQRRVIRLVKL
jgi:N-acetylneuraminic acid mutarotase